MHSLDISLVWSLVRWARIILHGCMCVFSTCTCGWMQPRMSAGWLVFGACYAPSEKCQDGICSVLPPWFFSPFVHMTFSPSPLAWNRYLLYRYATPQDTEVVQKMKTKTRFFLTFLRLVTGWSLWSGTDSDELWCVCDFILWWWVVHSLS